MSGKLNNLHYAVCDIVNRGDFYFTLSAIKAGNLIGAAAVTLSAVRGIGFKDYQKQIFKTSITVGGAFGIIANWWEEGATSSLNCAQFSYEQTKSIENVELRQEDATSSSKSSPSKFSDSVDNILVGLVVPIIAGISIVSVYNEMDPLEYILDTLGLIGIVSIIPNLWDDIMDAH